MSCLTMSATSNRALQCSDASLLCTEVLDLSELNPSPIQHHLGFYPDMPVTVRALEDRGQLKDDRILQNLLRNEDKYLPTKPDYMLTLASCGSGITPDMRKIVADWMLEVVHEQNSQPEVFYMAMNIVDRFLCLCRISKSQLQLLGAVAILISSKIREPCPIPGKTLITYTDYSITAEEIKEWELLVLYKLQWEVTAITPLDYLDHTIPRLGLQQVLPDAKFSLTDSDLRELRRRTETILVLCATRYQFSYHSPSLLAASAILSALYSLSSRPIYTEVVARELKLRIQTVTHTATGLIDLCLEQIESVLPAYLKAPLDSNSNTPVSPDSTSNSSSIIKSVTVITQQQQQHQHQSAVSEVSSSSMSPDPDLACAELLSNESIDLEVDESGYFGANQAFKTRTVSGASSYGSRSSSPLSAVDIFTDFSTNVLQKAYAEVEADGVDPTYSILCS